VSAIFISYTGRDIEGDAWADRLTEWFKEWEYGYFRDKDHSHGIKAGDEWRPALYRNLGLAQAMVCLCSKEYERSPWCVGEVAIALREGKTVIPIHLARSAEELKTQPLPSSLQTRQAIKVTAAHNPSAQELAEAKQRLQDRLQETLKWRELLDWDENQQPYPGLPAFEEHQAPVFFGRDDAIEAVVQRLTGLALSAPGFLLLLGASGYGKSSLVRAGVVPRLKSNRDRNWKVLKPFTPKGVPFTRLREVLGVAGAAVVEPGPEVGHEFEEAALQVQLQKLSAGPCVVVIDQFEELLVNGNQEGERFLAFLQRLLKEGLIEVVVVATMRTDFLAQLQSRWPQLLGLASTLPLEPIPLADYGELISGPAKRADLSLQSGLLERLVNDSNGEDGKGQDALPLLAFTLEKLWKKRQDREGPVIGPRGERWDLTVADYTALGGVDGAVQNQAALCWNPENGDSGDAEALRDAFLRHLVTVNEEGKATKRPAQLQDLPERSRPILERMVKQRLLVARGTVHTERTVEIAHEALLRTWEPLVKWIEAGKEELLQCLRVKRLGEDLSPEAPERQRRQALEQLTALAAAGGSEQRAVQKEATESLTHLLVNDDCPLADREDAALVLALTAAEDPLRQYLADNKAPVALRRRAAESLGLLARRSGARVQRQRIVDELEQWLRSDALNLLVLDAEGWAEHDARLPLLQGASRGLQLAASADLPLLGSGPGRVVSMLTLTALEECSGLRIVTEVVERPVWKLPLPGGEQLELVMVPSGEAQLGSPGSEHDRQEVMDWFAANRDGCRNGVDVEALRPVRLEALALVRHPISQGQWRSVVEAVGENERERELDAAPGKATPEILWERHGQPGELAVDSVSWQQGREWLGRLNRWLKEQWQGLGGSGEAPQLALPSENQWEGACRAGTTTPFHYGDTLDGSWARYDASYTFGLGRKGAKSKQPWLNGASGLVNRWGLAELHGQLYEWCEDSWHPNPVGQGRPEDGQPWRDEDADLVRRESGQRGWKLLRGGSWLDDPHDARAAFRLSRHPDHVLTDVGVRPGCFSPPGSLGG
jgi:formylglycine-generating enzyme required for sulfatase activity